MTVEDIKEAIAGLTEKDKASLASWLNLQTVDAWDREMQRDFAPGGKGIEFLEQVKREISEGETRSLEEGFEERRRRRS